MSVTIFGLGGPIPLRCGGEVRGARYSDWAYEPVKQSLFGLSSGTWTNQDVAARMQIVPLHVQLMKDRVDGER